MELLARNGQNSKLRPTPDSPFTTQDNPIQILAWAGPSLEAPSHPWYYMLGVGKTTLKTNGQCSKKTAKDCDDEWRADGEAKMKHGMSEDSYVEQCSVPDDVPAISSETKTNAAPSAAPK